jgi:hypothetical protein
MEQFSSSSNGSGDANQLKHHVKIIQKETNGLSAHKFQTNKHFSG